ncbi:(2Fe-2S)-binding protein [Azorhizobium doebereinerae]|uniref:(2Fe-2S)-binding protein n=1 Tax=Azorhizobium doebereinerae TaxID=281091 RepID=UPI0003FA8975|nr:(2Fe-2S)-binding protein [Azorhizobium doebereinerae]
MTQPDQRPTVTITVDGAALRAREGEMLTTALARHGLLRLRRSPNAGTPRGAFCHMGVCQECALHVDGAIRQACLTPVSAGMAVERRGVL